MLAASPGDSRTNGSNQGEQDERAAVLKDTCLPSSAKRDRGTKETLRARRRHARGASKGQGEEPKPCERRARHRGDCRAEDDKAHAVGNERKTFSGAKINGEGDAKYTRAGGHWRKWRRL